MRIKFITLNLWTGGRLLDPAVDFLQAEKPDIIVIQEAYNGKDPDLERRFRSAEVLKEELKLSHAAFSAALMDVYDQIELDQGQLILSKFPITETNTIFYDISFGKRPVAEGPGDFSLTPRNLQHSVIDAGGTKLNVFNTQGIWGFDGYDTDRRLKMGKMIEGQIREKENIILAGDFNMFPETDTIRGIENHVKNVFKGELQSTFNMRRKGQGNWATSVVDMIFASNNLKIVDHYCPDVDISDHLPLVCVFDI